MIWSPISKAREDRRLPFAVKKALSPAYAGHDGSLCSGQFVLGEEDVLYLKGLRDGGVEEIRSVLERIDKYGEILISYEC